MIEHISTIILISSFLFHKVTVITHVELMTVSYPNTLKFLGYQTEKNRRVHVFFVRRLFQKMRTWSCCFLVKQAWLWYFTAWVQGQEQWLALTQLDLILYAISSFNIATPSYECVNGVIHEGRQLKNLTRCHLRTNNFGEYWRASASNEYASTTLQKQGQ